MFAQEMHPPIRLLIFGDGPDGAPSQVMRTARLEANEVVDPHQLAIEADQWTAVVVKSHNYGRDFAALQKLLPLDLRYVGLMVP